jgi:hypothetical protein
MMLVQLAHEAAELFPQHPLHGNLIRCHHVHLEISRPEGRGDLQPDKAGTDHDYATRLLRGSDDGPAVVQRAQIADVRQLSARDI